MKGSCSHLDSAIHTYDIWIIVDNATSYFCSQISSTQHWNGRTTTTWSRSKFENPVIGIHCPQFRLKPLYSFRYIFRGRIQRQRRRWSAQQMRKEILLLFDLIFIFMKIIFDLFFLLHIHAWVTNRFETDNYVYQMSDKNIKISSETW